MSRRDRRTTGFGILGARLRQVLLGGVTKIVGRNRRWYPLTNTKDASAGSVSPSVFRGGVPQVHALRAPKPQACGCGLPVAFDVETHEFFCIGCGGAHECTCRRSLLSSTVRPLNVV
jgi:hypothetical protein